MKILVINGPNLNMLGIREPDIYGAVTYNDLVKLISDYASEKGVLVECYQSNYEGAIVDKIQQAYFEKFDGIVINPGAFTHTSIAILDALKAVQIKAVEVHISNVQEREAFRSISFIREYCVSSVIGKGVKGYLEAIDILMNK